MKKRMLITTIVMMLVLAVALTTSSLAWFSASQANVSATGGTFTATTAGSAANIGVATDSDATNWGNTAAMVTTGSTTLVPLCAIEAFETSLDADLAEGTTLASIANAESLNGAKVLYNGEGQQVFPLNGGDNAAYKNTLASQANSVIYAKNQDDNGSIIKSLEITLKITETTKAEGKDNVADPNFFIVLEQIDKVNGNTVLRTAVISKVGGYVAYDFSAASENTPLRDVDKGENRITGDAVINNAAEETAVVTFSNLGWAPDTVYAIHVYAWYEGETLDVTSQGCSTTYDLSMKAGI